MKDWAAVQAFKSGIFPDVLAINSTGAATQDGTEYIAEQINNGMFGPTQAMMDYSAGGTNPDVGTVGVPNGVTEAAGFSQLIEAMHKGFGIGPGVYKPYGKFLDPSVTGDRILLLSNQGILIASFPELVAATYVGDGNNPTAPFFYKSVLADGLTRNTAGPFFILPPENPTYRRQYAGALAAASLDFDISASVGSLVVVDAWAIYTKTSSGEHILDLFWDTTHASTTDIIFTFTGITFLTGTTQPATWTGDATTAFRAFTTGGASTVRLLTAAGITSSRLRATYNLDSAPTFIDGFTFPWGITY